MLSLLVKQLLSPTTWFGYISVDFPSEALMRATPTLQGDTGRKHAFKIAPSAMEITIDTECEITIDTECEITIDTECGLALGVTKTASCLVGCMSHIQS